jgi:RNase adapter protein RapZ
MSQMATSRPAKSSKAAPKRKQAPVHHARRSRLVIITGISGSGKASVLKAFEDLGYYCVDNLPVELMPQFAELIRASEDRNAALVVDIREGTQLEQVPRILSDIKKQMDTTVVYLDADDAILVRRFSETRRPHPLGQSESVHTSLQDERARLRPIRRMADIVIDTSKFNVHELRAHVIESFQQESSKPKTILVSTVSFGFKKGVPENADLVFDVRFLPNPHFVPELRPFTGRHPKVAKYIRSFPQTEEFINRISDLLIYLLPHYIEEGKSYLSIAFGCTGGQHRSVMIAEEVKKRLAKAGYRVKVDHRDSPK